MERRWNLRGQRVQTWVGISIRLVGDLVYDGHDAGKSRGGRRGSGSYEQTAALLNDITIMTGSRERHIRHIPMVLIGRAGINSRHPVTGLPGWRAMNYTDAAST